MKKSPNPTEAEKAWLEFKKAEVEAGRYTTLQTAFQAGRESQEREIKIHKDAVLNVLKQLISRNKEVESLKQRIAELENKKIYPQPSFDAICHMDAEQVKQAMKPRTVKELEENHEERQATFNKNMRRALAKKKEVGEG